MDIFVNDRNEKLSNKEKALLEALELKKRIMDDIDSMLDTIDSSMKTLGELQGQLEEVNGIIDLLKSMM